MGEIQDRTREHLGQSDKAINAYRRLLRQAIDAAKNGGTPPMVLDPKTAPSLTGPAAIDGIGPTDDWQGYWQKTDAVQAPGRELGEWAVKLYRGRRSRTVTLRCERSEPRRATAPLHHVASTFEGRFAATSDDGRHWCG